MDGLTIMVAPNGARRMPADHPALPVTVPAIARACAEVHALGAQAVHVHVRDREGRHHGTNGLLDRGQRIGAPARLWCVIEAYNRQVFGNTQAKLPPGRIENRNGHVVVGAEHRFGRLRRREKRPRGSRCTRMAVVTFGL